MIGVLVVVVIAGVMLIRSGSTPVQAPTDLATSNSSASTTPARTFTVAEVATHNSQTSCYSIVRGAVYDLTAWIGQHPGGSKAILGICGKDGTAAFEGQHGGKGGPEKALTNFKIGVVAQ